MPEHPHLYFAYGSNLNRAEMRVRCPAAKPLGRATLEGWRLTFRGVAEIEPAPGWTVPGALWLLSPPDLAALDRYEGAPVHYRRELVEVVTGGETVRALTYVMCDRDHLGLPSELYYGRIERGYRDWALPLGPLELALSATRRKADGARRTSGSA